MITQKELEEWTADLAAERGTMSETPLSQLNYLAGTIEALLKSEADLKARIAWLEAALRDVMNEFEPMKRAIACERARAALERT